MTTYTAEDFKNARFATHPDGRIAMRRDPGKHNAWFTSNGSIPSDINMAQGGWAPAQECPNPDQHDDRYVSPLAVSRVQEVQVRLEQAEQERDEALARVDRVTDRWQTAAAREAELASMTAREHLDAAWEAAHVPEGNIPEGADYITRWDDGRMAYRRAESPYLAPWEVDIYGDRSERRLLDPPAPARPEGAEGVETALLDADEAGFFNIAPRAIQDLADWLAAERGVSVTGAES